MKPTAAEAAPRVKLCPTCKTPFVEVPDDEREAFELPAVVCTCDLKGAQAAVSSPARRTGRAASAPCARPP